MGAEIFLQRHVKFVKLMTKVFHPILDYFSSFLKENNIVNQVRFWLILSPFSQYLP